MSKRSSVIISSSGCLGTFLGIFLACLGGCFFETNEGLAKSLVIIGIVLLFISLVLVIYGRLQSKKTTPESIDTVTIDPKRRLILVIRRIIGAILLITGLTMIIVAATTMENGIGPGMLGLLILGIGLGFLFASTKSSEVTRHQLIRFDDFVRKTWTAWRDGRLNFIDEAYVHEAQMPYESYKNAYSRYHAIGMLLNNYSMHDDEFLIKTGESSLYPKPEFMLTNKRFVIYDESLEVYKEYTLSDIKSATVTELTPASVVLILHDGERLVFSKLESLPQERLLQLAIHEAHRGSSAWATSGNRLDDPWDAASIELLTGILPKRSAFAATFHDVFTNLLLLISIPISFIGVIGIIDGVKEVLAENKTAHEYEMNHIISRIVFIILAFILTGIGLLLRRFALTLAFEKSPLGTLVKQLVDVFVYKKDISLPVSKIYDLVFSSRYRKADIIHMLARGICSETSKVENKSTAILFANALAYTILAEIETSTDTAKRDANNAIGLFKLAHEYGLNTPLLWYSMAQSHRIAENYEEAILLYHTYLNLRPEDHTAIELMEKIHSIAQIKSKLTNNTTY